MATRTKRPKPAELTEAQALEIMPRRARRWRKLNTAELWLKKKRKVVEKDMRMAIKVVKGRTWEGEGVKVKLVRTHPLDKQDTKNVADILRDVKREDLDRVMPRTIDAETLETLYPELYARLKKLSRNRFEIDLIKVEVTK